MNRPFSTDTPSHTSRQRQVTVGAFLGNGRYRVTDVAGTSQPAFDAGNGTYMPGDKVMAEWSPTAGSYVLTPSAGAGGGSSFYLDGKWTYDFARDGGAIGTIPLVADPSMASGVIPSGARIISVYIDIQTALDNAGTPGNLANIGMLIESATPGPGGDVIAKCTVDNWTVGNANVGGGFDQATGFRQNIFPSSGTADRIVLTADRTPSIIVSDFALTAGKFLVLPVWQLP